MTTRTKLYISSYTASAMILLTVFSRPLRIPEAFQWVLIIGAFVPLRLVFHFIKLQKLESQAPPASAEPLAEPVDDARQNAKRRLILLMLLGSAVGLCAPLWLPVAGTTLGARGDFICGLITVAVVCSIFGFKLKRL